jgi:uncharacterized membrane protein
LIPAFAERKVVVGEGGLAKLMGNAEERRARYADIHAMFLARSSAEILSPVHKYKIDYLYVGPWEQQLYPDFLRVVQSEPRLFEEVYSRDNVHVFHCKR